MTTNTEHLDLRSVNEHSDMRHKKICEMLNRPNAESTTERKRLSTIPEYIELSDVPIPPNLDHQYERVQYSAIEDINANKLKVIKHFLSVVFSVVIIVAVVLLCIIFGIYIWNMLNADKILNQENTQINSAVYSKFTTKPTTNSMVASTIKPISFETVALSTRLTSLSNIVSTTKPTTIPTTFSTTKSTTAPTKPTIVFKSVSTTVQTTRKLLPKIIPKTRNELEEKRQFVKEMMLDSWNTYVRYAWGQEALAPVSKTAYSHYIGNNSGLSIVASMSTLWTMGLAKEFKMGKKWIMEQMNLSKIDRNAGVFHVIANYVGGLLSLYALTSDQLFLNKAQTIGQLVEPAFSAPQGLPFEYINLRTGQSSTILYQFLQLKTGFQLEFNYLSDALGMPKFRNQIQKIRQVLKGIKPKVLYKDHLDFEERLRSGGSSDFFSGSSEAYTSLVKSYIQSNHRDAQSIEMYKEVLDAMEAVKLFKVSPGGLYFVSNYDFKLGVYGHGSMLYIGCYLGAMLSLGGSGMQRALMQLALDSSIGDMDKVTQQNRINRHWYLAQQVTQTCQQASDKTKTGLGPYEFSFTKTHEIIPDQYFSHYSLSAELAESNFILWRLTHNQKYRDNAWQMTQALHRHCRVESGGYSGVRDVNEVPTIKKDRQHSIFLSATLKYLYLTFTDDSVLSLDQFVFNSVGHPLPICGNNTMYPTKQCKS